MPPRTEPRRTIPRASRVSAATTPEDVTTLWPDEGSDEDPEYVPSETESETDDDDDISIVSEDSYESETEDSDDDESDESTDTDVDF